MKHLYVSYMHASIVDYNRLHLWVIISNSYFICTSLSCIYRALYVFTINIAKSTITTKKKMDDLIIYI